MNIAGKTILRRFALLVMMRGIEVKLVVACIFGYVAPSYIGGTWCDDREASPLPSATMFD